MSGHIDVDIPSVRVGRVGTSLNEFEIYLRNHGLFTTRVMKPGWSNVRPLWIYCNVARSASLQGRLQFGATKHKSVNESPHMWVRGRRPYIQAGKDLLHSFINNKLNDRQFYLCRRAVEPFCGSTYGNGCLDFEVGDLIAQLPPPGGAQTWAYGLHIASGERGWYPPTFTPQPAYNSQTAGFWK